MSNTQPKRVTPLRAAINALAKEGITVQPGQLSKSQIRLEVALALAKNQFIFQLGALEQINGVAPYNTERRLNVNDAFFATRAGFFLGTPISNTAADFNLQTYPQTPAFSGTAGSRQAAETMYNGELNILTALKTLLPKWPLCKHRQVPYNVAETSGMPQIDGDDSGFVDLSPRITLQGNIKTDIKLDIPAPLAFVANFSRAILIFDGYLATNVLRQ